MSEARVAFRVMLQVGDQIVPLRSEVVSGDAASRDGVTRGFVFALDLQPIDPPVTVTLGHVIDFIERQLGVGTGTLSTNPDVAGSLVPAFPGMVTASNFTADNDVAVDIRSFLLNSSSEHTLFSISVDVRGTDPGAGLISLPPQVASWLKVESLAISFSATGTSA